MGQSRADAVARAAAVLMGVAFGVTVVAAIDCVLRGAVLGNEFVRLDPLAAILTLLVTGLSALIQAFAVRYLRGDTRQLWFVGAANLLTGFTVLLVSAATVVVFAAAWIGAGGALVLLLATYPQLDQAREGVRRTALRFVIADGAFLAGVIGLIATAGGDIPLAGVGEIAAELPPLTQFVIAALIVTAALARSSQLPFTGWLPFTLAAPTPVSALMHAGVVNAGAIMLVRFAPVVAVHQLIMIGIFVAGAATLVYASAARLARPDVKGRLVYSTMAQMGFMIMACGLGLYAAAIFHLVAHSLFKSALFLGAGMGVREHAVDRDLPARRHPTRLGAAAAVSISVIVPAAALVGAKLVFSPDTSAASLGLLVFVAVTASVAVASALMTDFTARTVTVTIGSTIALAVGYVAFLAVFVGVLTPALEQAAAPAWLLLAPAVGLLVVQLLARNPARLAGLRDLVYARATSVAVSRPPQNGAVK